MTEARYEIVRRDSAGDLAYMVNDYLKHGYTPLGSPTVLNGQWTQAVYRSPQ